MPEDKKRAQQKYKTMEGNYLTAGDLALIENRRGYGYGDGYGRCIMREMKKAHNKGCYGLILNMLLDWLALTTTTTKVVGFPAAKS